MGEKTKININGPIAIKLIKKDNYATVFDYTKVFNEDRIFLYEKIRCSFNDEYNEKRDMTPVRELKIHQDKTGKYVIHRHQKYYLD